MDLLELRNEIDKIEGNKEEIKGTKIKEIGEEAFRGIENLERVVLPEGITTIGNNAFSNIYIHVSSFLRIVYHKIIMLT